MRWKTTDNLEDILKYFGEYIIIKPMVDCDKCKLYYKYKLVNEDEWIKFYIKQQKKKIKG